MACPLVVAHRGFSGAAPENTLEAFRLALDAGADGIELDTRLTRDGHVAVMHDRRVDRTTNASGVVGTFTLAQLKELDAGSWYDPRFKGARVPSLDEVLRELPAETLLNVELKVRGLGVVALAWKVTRAIRRHQRWATTLVASFNPLALVAARVLEPRVARGYIWGARQPIFMRRPWMQPLVRSQWMDPDRHTLVPDSLARYHRQGRRVMAWDGDAGFDLPRMCAMRLDAVVTDNPDRYRDRKRDMAP